MDFKIELLGGRDTSKSIDLSFAMAEEWPEFVYVSWFAPGAVCVSPSLAGWQPEVIDKVFQIFKRTDQTNERGRRIYVIEP